jgi:hypothetical protein
MVALCQRHRIASLNEEEPAIEEPARSMLARRPQRGNLQVEAKPRVRSRENLLNFERTVVSPDKAHAPRRPPVGPRRKSGGGGARSRAAARSFLPFTSARDEAHPLIGENGAGPVKLVQALGDRRRRAAAAIRNFSVLVCDVLIVVSEYEACAMCAPFASLAPFWM